MINIQPPLLVIQEWSPASFALSALTTGSNTLTASLSWSLNKSVVQATLTSGSPITSVYSIASATALQVGSYTLTFTGSIAGVEIGRSSSVASTLIVNPLLITSPTGFMGMEGSAAGSITSTFSSSIPMTFVWTRNGSAITIEGTQTDSTSGSILDLAAGLYIPQVGGGYTLRATTTSGSSASDVANVTFMPLGIDAASLGQQTWSPYNGGRYV